MWDLFIPIERKYLKTVANPEKEKVFSFSGTHSSSFEKVQSKDSTIIIFFAIRNNQARLSMLVDKAL